MTTLPASLNTKATGSGCSNVSDINTINKKDVNACLSNNATVNKKQTV